MSDDRPAVRIAGVCDSCGKPVPIGGWPFCASTANPLGHTKGAYHWSMRMSMKTNGWTRKEK